MHEKTKEQLDKALQLRESKAARAAAKKELAMNAKPLKRMRVEAKREPEMDVKWSDHTDLLIEQNAKQLAEIKELLKSFKLPQKASTGELDPANTVVHGIRYLAAQVFANAKNKGFWEDRRYPSGEVENLQTAIADMEESTRLCTALKMEKLMLITTEVAEAAEVVRKPDKPVDHDHGIDPFTEELADIIIRTLDLACALGLDIGQAVWDKHLYNCSRPPMHDKKC